MADNTDALRRMACEIEAVLKGNPADAEGFYRARADAIGALLDEARDALPRGEAPLEPEARAQHDAAEYLGQLYAALASWVLTGDPPDVQARGRR